LLKRGGRYVTPLHLTMVTAIVFPRLDANKYRVLQPAKLESLRAYKLQLQRVSEEHFWPLEDINPRCQSNFVPCGLQAVLRAN
jgi:hypothetical protein